MDNLKPLLDRVAQLCLKSNYDDVDTNDVNDVFLHDDTNLFPDLEIHPKLILFILIGVKLYPEDFSFLLEEESKLTYKTRLNEQGEIELSYWGLMKLCQKLGFSRLDFEKSIYGSNGLLDQKTLNPLDDNDWNPKLNLRSMVVKNLIKSNAFDTNDKPSSTRLVINQEVQNELNYFKRWLKYSKNLAGSNCEGAGFKMLLYGQPGTGKTSIARNLAYENNLKLVEIDGGSLFSKYIGETEKKIKSLFDELNPEKDLLVIDEGEGLFSKRFENTSAKDKYANQEVSCLLRAIEAYKGAIVLTTNQLENIDKAFKRRFHSIIKVSMPNTKERTKIWRYYLNSSINIDFRNLEHFKLSGANIKNVSRELVLMIYESEKVINDNVLEYLINRELKKENA